MMSTADIRKLTFEQLLSQFESELRALQDIARAAHEAATHEEAKSEDKHDTRAIEASYLAEGQARRAHELESAIRDLKLSLEAKTSPIERSGVGSLIRFEQDGRINHALLYPHGGGKKIEVSGHIIQIVNPASPLGEALDQQKPGDVSVYSVKNEEKEVSILSIE